MDEVTGVPHGFGLRMTFEPRCPTAKGCSNRSLSEGLVRVESLLVHSEEQKMESSNLFLYFQGDDGRLLNFIRREGWRKLQPDVSGVKIAHRNSGAGVDVCFRKGNLVVAFVGIGQINPHPDLVRF
jgi:hypothetical protein